MDIFRGPVLSGYGHFQRSTFERLWTLSEVQFWAVMDTWKKIIVNLHVFLSAASNKRSKLWIGIFFRRDCNSRSNRWIVTISKNMQFQ